MVLALVASCTSQRSEISPTKDKDGSSRGTALSTRYLWEPSTNIGTPSIVIGSYDATHGLLVGYQAESGKRIMFRAKFRLGGGIVAQTIHRDEATKKIAQLMGRSRQLDENGLPARDIEVGGVGMRALIKSKMGKAPDAIQATARLETFATGPAGLAMLDGIPAMYAALDSAAVPPEVASLLDPFGAVAMAIQLGAQQYRGFRGADSILGPQAATSLRSACDSTKECTFKGKSFTIHASGLFDALSDKRGSNSTRDGDGTCSSMGSECFGLCGPGCVTPGDIAATECYGHDYCVCAYGHGDCLIQPPDGCGGAQGVDCYSLWEAVGGWLGGLWDAFWDWVGEYFEDVPADSTEP
ncbi:MAG TPA: hypothetical protein PKU97_00910 [Kofleriaceae bacterium]|nr:hypothetical protein [Kofleriaceae bacterium]